MLIPLEKRLKKRLHIDVGLLQDEMVEVVYGLDGKAVLHGGTAIWRCYQGNRFSEDLDFYIRKNKRIENRFAEKVQRHGLHLLKFKKTANLCFAKVSNEGVEVRLEMNFSSKKKGTVKPFERVDGSLSNVLTLEPKELIVEKMQAYKNRRFVRDLYDVFFLTRHVEKPAGIRKEVQAFLQGIKKPVDEKNLKTIVFSGAIPSFEQMLQGIKGAFK